MAIRDVSTVAIRVTSGTDSIPVAVDREVQKRC